MMIFMTGVAIVIALVIAIVIKVREGFQRANLARLTNQATGFGNSFTLDYRAPVSPDE